MTNLAHATRSENTCEQDRPNPPPISALALIETVSAAEVFTQSGLDPILERVEKEARSYALDISTERGRKEVASLAHKIAKSKTALDKLGKDLVSEWKAQAKKVDAERSRAWDRLEALQKEIRQPLTDWENREKDRIAKHEANLAEIILAGSHTTANWQNFSVEAMNDRLKELLSDKTDWEEFSSRAKHALEASTDAIAAAILKRQKHDAEQAELARLRKEEEERKQREHEERLKAEAAEKARIEAEAKARKEAEAEAARVAAEQAKAEKERQRIQREKEEAEARVRKAEQEKKDALAKAEQDRIAAAEKAERDRIAAAENAKQDAERAAQRERERIEAEKRAEAEATAKREADKAHRATINREAIQRLMDVVSPHSIVDPTATAAVVKAVIEAIAEGNIPHVKIHY